MIYELALIIKDAGLLLVIVAMAHQAIHKPKYRWFYLICIFILLLC